MSALASTQARLQERILHGDAAVFPRVRGADAAQRLRIYADAYRLRLVDVLGNDFPATRDALGEAAFAAFAERYLRAHRPTQPSVRHVGSDFTDWLGTQDDAPRGLHELARLEWLQAAAFDAADARTLGLDDVAALPSDAWPALQLHLHPCVRLLDSTHLAIVDDAPALSGGDSPARWLLWRDAGGDVHWRQLEGDEADALHAISHGATFGDTCERLATHHGAAGALRAASLLKRWLADGLFAAGAHRSD